MKKRFLTMALALCMLLSLLPFGVAAADFSDVPADAFFAKPVQWAVSKGVTDGTSDTTFSPDNTCTRGQVVTFLWRAANQPEPTAKKSSFSDVTPDAYFGKAVLWAVEKGITDGTSDTTFSPDDGCTRGQVVTFLHRAEGNPAAEGGKTFSDVANDAYYADAVKWAVSKEITDGTSDTTFSPDATCTRGQIVTFLYRDAQSAPASDKVVYLVTKETNTFSYDDVVDGKAVKTTRTDVAVYTYDAHGNNVKLVHDDGLVETAAYDAKGLRVQRTYSNDVEKRTAKYEHDESGRLVKETVWWEYDPEFHPPIPLDETVKVVTTYSYDKEGRLIESVCDTQNYGEIDYEQMTYDAQGNMTKMISKRVFADGSFTAEEHTYVYDAHGNTTHYTWTSVESGTDKKVTRQVLKEEFTSYFYDENGRVSSYVVMNADSERTGRGYYTYDAHGNVTKDAQLDADGKEVCVTTNVYDANDNLIRSEFRSGDHVSVTTYEYKAFPADKLPPLWEGPMIPDIFA